ncbi:MAG TPA: polysaccharide biosynthesis C-terminal domain-containing protein [Methylomirabilota bacterium]|nr:polysaccharide biosynthesis C-terminal domain-containing protein [Methylomirabilota bacterium]
MIGRNVSALVAAQFATKAVNLLVSVALVRWLGVHELGRYAYVLAFCFPFGALADFGLATLAIRDASRAPAEAPRILAVVRRAALALAAASAAAMTGLALALGHDGAIVAAIGLGGLASIVSALTMPSLVLLTARERLDRLSLHRVAGSVLSSAATAGVLLAGGGVVALLAGSLGTSAVMWLVARALAGDPGRAPAVPAGAGAALLRRAVPFGLLMAGFALYYRVDMVMLEWLAAPGELGRYAAAYRFLDAVVVLAASLGGPLFPRLSSVAVGAPAEARRLLEAGWRPLLALGLPLTVGTVAVAGDLVALLFGAEFAGAAPLLRLLILGTLPLFWINIANHALIAADRVWALVGVYALSALVNVAGNLVLVPRWGAAGAAVATVACEWLNLVLVVRLVREAFGVTLAISGLWRYLLATGAMLAVVWTAQPLGVAAAVALAAGAYAAALWALGYTRSADHLAVKRLLAQ